jgi:hypothetical protein
MGRNIGFGGGINFKWDFGRGFSLSAGVGASWTVPAWQTHSLNIAVNVYNTGVGTRSGVYGKPDDQTYIDFIISPAITVGNPTVKNPAILNTFNNNTASGVMNYRKNSFTFGTNFVKNSIGRNQQVGYIGFKLNKFDFSFYNDFIPLLGDTEDRWWTGGGSLNLGPLFVGTDVFTEIRDKDSYKFNPEKNKYEWKSDPAGNLANGHHGTYYQNSNAREFNNGQTIISLRNKNASMGFVMTGSKHMWSQNLIHNYGFFKNLLFYSEAKPQYGITGQSGVYSNWPK